MKRYIYIKYILDFICALILLALTSWVMLFCALAIKLDDPKAPVMYNATRIGKNLRPFKMYKFRTMKRSYEGVGRVSEETLTRPGRFLRKTSLDELPQLINIIKGDMSFIGPRPLTERYVPWYTKRQNLRHTVRPGLTGLAQINGRVNLGWNKRFMYDVFYVENLSFLSDLKIILSTFHKTLRGQDAMLNENNGESFDYFDEFQQDQIAKKLVSESELISYRPAAEELTV